MKRFKCIDQGNTQSTETGEIYNAVFLNYDKETGVTSYRLFSIDNDHPVGVIKDGFDDGFYHRCSFPTAIFAEVVEG